MSPTNQSQLEEQLMRLPAATREDILSFFSQDLRSLNPKKIVGNLEMVLLFMRQLEEPEFKKQIFARLAPENHQIRELVDYLTPLNPPFQRGETKGGKVSLHPQDYVQTSFPDNDHFDFKDMQEVDRFRRAGASPFPPGAFQEKLDAVLKILPREVQERFRSDPLARKRFESVVVTYLKDIRDRLETFSRLAAEVKEGGVGLGHEVTEKIFNVLDGKVDHTENLPKLEPIPQIPEVVKTPPAAQRVATESEPIKTPVLPQKINIPRAAPPHHVQKVTDIKPPGVGTHEQKQKSVDPIEVYSTLTIEDLRRERAPEEFTKKLEEKIQSESAADYMHRAKMISAWKRSPLYKLYLAIGQESLVQGINVVEYLTKKAGGSSMTYQEFEAIAELNRRLRF